MTPKQELKEKMRLYEMYSIAVLAGNPKLHDGWTTEDLGAFIDAVAREMIAYHYIYRARCEHDE